MKVVLWFAGVLLVAGVLFSAPAPFPRAPRPLRHSGLVGTWEVQWSGVKATFILSADGRYRCLWDESGPDRTPACEYVGTWSTDRYGRLWISESNCPQSAASWHHYCIRLDPVAMSGPVEVGATGVTVSMRRKR